MIQRPIRNILLPLLLVFALSACASSGADDSTKISESTFMRLADKSYQKGDLPMAAAMYEKAVGESPKSVAAHAGYGKVMMDMGNYAEAAAAYEKALKLKPEDREIQRNMANVLIADSKPKEAQKILLKMIKEKPDAKLYNALGVAYDSEGRNKDAQQAYQKGLDLSEHNLALLNNLGLSQAFSGKTKEAVTTLQKVTSNQAGTARHRQNLAFAYVANGQKTLAEKVLRMDMSGADATRALEFYTKVAKLKNSVDKMQALQKGALAPGV